MRIAAALAACSVLAGPVLAQSPEQVRLARELVSANPQPLPTATMISEAFEREFARRGVRPTPYAREQATAAARQTLADELPGMIEALVRAYAAEFTVEELQTFRRMQTPSFMAKLGQLRALRRSGKSEAAQLAEIERLLTDEELELVARIGSDPTLIRLGDRAEAIVNRVIAQSDARLMRRMNARLDERCAKSREPLPWCGAGR